MGYSLCSDRIKGYFKQGFFTLNSIGTRQKVTFIGLKSKGNENYFFFFSKKLRQSLGTEIICSEKDDIFMLIISK